MTLKKKLLAVLLAGVSVLGTACSSDSSDDTGTDSGADSGAEVEPSPEATASEGVQGATKEQQEQIDQINNGVTASPTP